MKCNFVRYFSFFVTLITAHFICCSCEANEGKFETRIKACANLNCDAPIGLAIASGNYESKKSDHLVFYKDEKIYVYERYITPPYGKIWVGQVDGVDPVRRAKFPKNLVKEVEVYVTQPVEVEEKIPIDVPTEQTDSNTGDLNNSPQQQDIEEEEEIKYFKERTEENPVKNDIPQNGEINTHNIQDSTYTVPLANNEGSQQGVSNEGVDLQNAETYQANDQPQGSWAPNTNQDSSDPLNVDTVNAQHAVDNKEAVDPINAYLNDDFGLGNGAKDPVEAAQIVMNDAAPSSGSPNLDNNVVNGDGNRNQEVVQGQTDTLNSQNAQADGLEQEKVAWQKAEDERVAWQKAEAERSQQEKIAWEKAEADRLAAEKAEADRLEAERVASEKKAAEKAEADRLQQEKIAWEKAEAERIAAEKAEAERIAAEKAETERIAAEKAEADRLEAERLERIASEKLEAERLQQEKIAWEKAEADRVAAERAEADRLAAEKQENERLAAEKAEAERLQQEKIAWEKAEADRIAAEKAEADRLAAQKKENERLAAEKAETERLQQEKIAWEKAEAERIAAEKAEADRLTAEKQEYERVAAEKAEVERLEQEKIAAEKAEADRLEQEKIATEKAEAERLENERIAWQKAEDLRLEQEAEQKRLKDEELELARLVEEQKQLDLKKEEEARMQTADTVTPSAVIEEAPVEISNNENIAPTVPDVDIHIHPSPLTQPQASQENVNYNDNNQGADAAGTTVAPPTEQAPPTAEAPPTQEQTLPSNDADKPDEAPSTIPGDVMDDVGTLLDDVNNDWPTGETDQKSGGDSANTGDTQEQGNQLNSEGQQQYGQQQDTDGMIDPQPDDQVAQYEDDYPPYAVTETVTEAPVETVTETVTEAPVEAVTEAPVEAAAEASSMPEQQQETIEEVPAEAVMPSPEVSDSVTETSTDTPEVEAGNEKLNDWMSDMPKVVPPEPEEGSCSKPCNCTQDQVGPIDRSSKYPKILGDDGTPQSYMYSVILSTTEPGLEYQSWVIASVMPEFMQSILVREMYGLSGADLALYLIVSCSVLAAMLSYLPLMWCFTCLEARGNSKQLNNFAQEQMNKRDEAEARSSQLENELKTSQNEATMAQEECKEAQAKTREVEEELRQSNEEIQTLKQSGGDITAAVDNLQAQLDQANKYITDWTAYSASQQQAYEAEVVKTKQLSEELAEKSTQLEEANKKVSDASDLSGLNKSETDAMQSAIKELKSKVKELQEESSQKDENISDTEQQNSDLSEKVSTLESRQAELEEAVTLRDNELDILRACVAQVTKTSSDSGEDEEADQKKEQALQALMDTAKVQSELSDVRVELESLKRTLEAESRSKSDLEVNLVTLQQDKERLGSDKEQTIREKNDAEAALKHMTSLYDKANGAITRLNAAAESGGADKTVAELRQQITDLKSEVAQWRDRCTDKEEEYKTSERDLRRRVMEAEKKAHEVWFENECTPVLASTPTKPLSIGTLHSTSSSKSAESSPASPASIVGSIKPMLQEVNTNSSPVRSALKSQSSANNNSRHIEFDLSKNSFQSPPSSQCTSDATSPAPSTHLSSDSDASSSDSGDNHVHVHDPPNSPSYADGEMINMQNCNIGEAEPNRFNYFPYTNLVWTDAHQNHMMQWIYRIEGYHELIHRDADRKVAALRQENDNLKRGYAVLEDELRDLDFTYQDLKYQMEARERSLADDSSMLDGKRPMSRNSIRSRADDNRHSMSPRVAAEDSKPVDPLRAPPPASTYKKSARNKKKAQQLRAQKMMSESPIAADAESVDNMSLPEWDNMSSGIPGSPYHYDMPPQPYNNMPVYDPNYPPPHMADPAFQQQPIDPAYYQQQAMYQQQMAMQQQPMAGGEYAQPHMQYPQQMGQQMGQGQGYPAAHPNSADMQQQQQNMQQTPNGNNMYSPQQQPPL